MPAVFVIGLLLIPVGMWLQRRKLRRDPDGVAEWPVVDFREPGPSHRPRSSTRSPAVNVVILLLAGYGGLHAMESP